jgi:hypothetical protein
MTDFIGVIASKQLTEMEAQTFASIMEGMSNYDTHLFQAGITEKNMLLKTSREVQWLLGGKIEISNSFKNCKDVKAIGIAMLEKPNYSISPASVKREYISSFLKDKRKILCIHQGSTMNPEEFYLKEKNFIPQCCIYIDNPNKIEYVASSPDHMFKYQLKSPDGREVFIICNTNYIQEKFVLYMEVLGFMYDIIDIEDDSTFNTLKELKL